MFAKFLRAGSVAALLIMFACGNATAPFEDLMGIDVCDPSSQTFTTEIDNPFFPLPVGQRLVLKANGFFTEELVRITVLPEPETVAGVETRVVEEYEAKDGRVVEISRNYFAQTAEGYVCYFGEEVDIYDSEGIVASHLGAWRADGERNIPGIFMPPHPRVGQAFQQEIAPGIAEDEAMVTGLNESIEVPAGTFDDTVTILDRNPLDGSSGEKVYAKGIGLIVDAGAKLERFEAGTD
jgi:hypothetical protein